MPTNNYRRPHDGFFGGGDLSSESLVCGSRKPLGQNVCFCHTKESFQNDFMAVCKQGLRPKLLVFLMNKICKILYDLCMPVVFKTTRQYSRPNNKRYPLERFAIMNCWNYFPKFTGKLLNIISSRRLLEITPRSSSLASL